MDASQFAEFMAAFQQQQMQLFQTLMNRPLPQDDVDPSPPTSNPPVNVTFLQPFENFDPNKESFKYYRQRFENYLSLKGVLEDKNRCAQVLLNSIGATYFNMISALVAPKQPIDVPYDDLISTFECHLCPKKNVLVSQHIFLSTYQQENQSIADFVALLRQKSLDCDFISPCDCQTSISDVFLRAQFVRGIVDNSIREQILQSDVLSFNEIVKKALALEASKTDCRKISNDPAHVSNEPVNKIYSRSRSISRDTHRFRSRSVSRPKSDNHRRSSSSSRLDYDKLGLKNLCIRCGRDNHLVRDCNTKPSNLHCSACNKHGHVRKVCIRSIMEDRKNSNARSTTRSHQIDSTNNVSDDVFQRYGVNKIVDIFQQNKIPPPDVEKYFVTVSIEGQNFKFEVDSGAAFTFIPRQQFNKLRLQNSIQPSTVAFRSYTGNIFVPDGKVAVSVQYKNKVSKEEMYVVSDDFDALLGRLWIRHLGINLQDIEPSSTSNSSIFHIQQFNSIDRLCSKFPNIFQEKVGRVPNFTVSLQLRERAKPVFFKERELPYALRDKVDRELDDLEAQGIITKSTTSDWGSPLVVIPKPDGNVRLCVDYKIGVNPQLVNSNYPIKRIDEILNSLQNSRYFCRLDLFKAYLHIPVDEESSVIQTISTHRGTYKMNRLSFGIKTAPSEFNRILDQVLQGLPKTLSYFDDILVHGETKEECSTNLDLCLQRLEKFDLHLNKKKCSLFQEKIEYLGYLVQFNRISMNPEKVRALVDMPRPSSQEEIRRFLGMTTYYSRFLPNLSSITYPLRQLLRKDSKFYWSAACESAFIRLKNELSSDRTLIPYDPSMPLLLACDASPVGISGVLSHMINGVEKPIAFASRSLTPSEQNYSQLDREALAIVFAVDHFFNYLYGRHFKLCTDNKPLTRIFHQHSKIPPMTSSRLLRYATFLSAFDYEVVFKDGESNVNADCFSRAPVNQRSSSGDISINDEVQDVCMNSINQISTEILNSDSIRKETVADVELMDIKAKIETDPELALEYTLDNGILFKGQRVIVPKILRNAVLQELHRTHIGISKMKQLARRYVYWKGIDNDIEHLSRSCEPCAKMKSSPPKAQVHPWDEPQNNWDRIHIDYAGPFQGFWFLIVMDSKSRWAEIKICRTAPTSTSTIEMLSEIFSVHGYPYVMVSDNASIFVSDQFKTFCSAKGIFQKLIAPGHPATNGLAERNVYTLKSRLKAMSEDPAPMQSKIREILFRYRMTPLANNSTPAENYLGRKVRCELDALRPLKHSKNLVYDFHARQLSVGDRVQARYFQRNSNLWKFGSVVRKLGRLHYLIRLDEQPNGVVKRHINQLRRTDVNRKSVTFNDNVEAPDNHPPTTPQGRLYEDVEFYPTHHQPQRNPDNGDNSSLQNQPVVSNQPLQPELRRSGRVRSAPNYLRDYVTS